MAQKSSSVITIIKCDDILKVNKETLMQVAIPVILILSTFIGQEIHLQMHWVLPQQN
jgi:hypothetical protein